MAQEDTKRCTGCELSLPLDSFGFDRKYRRAKCKKCMSRLHAEWLASRAGAREMVAAHSRAYYSRNSSAHRGRVVDWFERNPGATDKFNHSRRARKVSASFRVSARELQRIREMPCLACGQPGPSTIDHIIPLARGGTDSVGNLAPLCGPCNSSKGTKTWLEWRIQKGARLAA
jgi:5-methylcytosine-specific restriction endonuclease McrA